MMEKRSYAHCGALLIVIGLIFLLLRHAFQIELLYLDIGEFWPAFVLGPGLLFEFSYFTMKSKPGLLVPGGTLTVIGALHFFEVGTDWVFSSYTWPVYILSPAVGLFQLYLFGNRNRGVLIASLFLALIAVVAAASMLIDLTVCTVDLSFVLAVMFIFVGVLMIFEKRDKKSE